MRRCETCRGAGWVPDGDGADMPCPRCTIPGFIYGSGWLSDDGIPVSINEAPGYIETVVGQTCPHCGFGNEIAGWDSLMMFTCRRCGKGVKVDHTVQ